jgi:hypothetical protein
LRGVFRRNFKFLFFFTFFISFLPSILQYKLVNKWSTWREIQRSTVSRHDLKIYVRVILVPGKWDSRTVWKHVFMQQYSWEVVFALWLHLLISVITLFLR